jgi:hypothetical protein
MYLVMFLDQRSYEFNPSLHVSRAGAEALTRLCCGASIASPVGAGSPTIAGKPLMFTDSKLTASSARKLT